MANLEKLQQDFERASGRRPGPKRYGCQREKSCGEGETPMRCSRREDYRATNDRGPAHLCWMCWHELGAEDRGQYERLARSGTEDVAPDAELYDRAVRERSAEPSVRVRPFVKELVLRGGVTFEEWSVPMNSFERELLVPELQVEVFVAQFIHCARNASPGMPGTYDWALVYEQVPEVVRRWTEVQRLREVSELGRDLGQLLASAVWPAGRTETERALLTRLRQAYARYREGIALESGSPF